MENGALLSLQMLHFDVISCAQYLNLSNYMLLCFSTICTMKVLQQKCVLSCVFGTNGIFFLIFFYFLFLFLVGIDVNTLLELVCEL